VDLHDLEHNTGDGLHMASLAGGWISLVIGLGGMRDHDMLSFYPRLPTTPGLLSRPAARRPGGIRSTPSPCCSHAFDGR
jgi:trehalose/maltose hydrolase-like predicted phosphorylase